jgi:PHD/YefM family antitoxin component YafN of YafNO toxin-antitoxin module
MHSAITANELKTKGVTAISRAVSGTGEAVITVRGRDAYVVLPLATYHHLRECELETALRESRNDIKKGRFVKESVAAHLKRITRA